MGIRLEKPWRPLGEIDGLPGQLGVFQLANSAGEVLLIGYAGARDLFGLRSAVADAAGAISGAASFRVEITASYLTRYQELLMVHEADFGALPAGNPRPPGLGRLSPA